MFSLYQEIGYYFLKKMFLLNNVIISNIFVDVLIRRKYFWVGSDNSFHFLYSFDFINDEFYEVKRCVRGRKYGLKLLMFQLDSIITLQEMTIYNSEG